MLKNKILKKIADPDDFHVDKKTEGKWVWYYESGKVCWERNYVDGKREGKSVGYWENGEIRDEDTYKDGECVEMCEGDEND